MAMKTAKGKIRHMSEQPLAGPLGVLRPLGGDDDDVRMWGEQGVIMLKAVTACGDPVEILFEQAVSVAHALLRLVESEREWEEQHANDDPGNPTENG